MTEVTLGGVPIRLQAGAPVCEYSPIGGVTSRRRSGGALVKMRNWRKTAITISGAGWMGPGFAGLNFDGPLELRCTQPLSLYTASLTGTLPGAVEYHVRWLPMFTVMCEPPPEGLDSGNAAYSWSITAEEV